MATAMGLFSTFRIGILCVLLACLWAAQAAQAGDSSDYTTVDWTDLIPPEELEILENPPAYLTEIEEGSAADMAGGQMGNSTLGDIDDPYQRALISTNVNEELDGKRIRIPGFVVPLEFDDFETITQFLFVPYFGACIHLPPPPPNQIILVNSPQGLELTELYDPFWLSGILNTSVVEHEMVKSAYSLVLQEYEAYYD